MLATYHNHSRWSDGKATVAEIIAAARSMGVDELGISDHWVLHPRNEKKSWAMPVEKLPAYVEEILQFKQQHAKTHGAPIIRLGLEVDWFPGSALPLRAQLQKYPFDYLIGSCHEVDLPGVGAFMIDMAPETWRRLSMRDRSPESKSLLNTVPRCHRRWV